MVNEFGVTPPKDDSDDEVAEAVRLALEKDPLVDASQIRIGAKKRVVKRTVIVPTESEREMAEFDAWYDFGVHRLVNRLAVKAWPGRMDLEITPSPTPSEVPEQRRTRATRHAAGCRRKARQPWPSGLGACPSNRVLLDCSDAT